MHTFNFYIHTVTSNRKALQTTLFLLALISLLFNLKYHLLLHQIGRNPILWQDIDPTYWTITILGLPDLFSSSLAIILDFVLFASCVGSMIWNRQRVTPIIFFVCYTLYFMLFNMAAGHHYMNIGVLVMSFPFIFYNNNQFGLAFSFCRLMFCFMFLAAGLWKVFRGNLLYPNQGHLLLISTHIESLFHNDHSIYFQIIQFFIRYKFMAHLLWTGLILLELLFIIGFISVKWDWLLLIAYLLFASGGYFFFYVYNYENLLFLFTLFPLIKLVETAASKLKTKRKDALLGIYQ